jgi:hypothetical protein
MSKLTPAAIHFIPVGMLVLALGRWPYEYYMLLRVVVFGRRALGSCADLSTNETSHNLDGSLCDPSYRLQSGCAASSNA